MVTVAGLTTVSNRAARRAPVRLQRHVIPLPFEPNEVWGTRDRHHVTGTVGGRTWRGPIERAAPLVLGAAWRRDCGIAAGDVVAVELSAEGPQRAELAPDLAAALEAEPAAAAFFDSLAQFYRKGYLTYIDATKRRPEVRAARIAEVVGLLKAEVKQRAR